jgi:hypothetical protein
MNFFFLDGNTIFGMNECTKPFQLTIFHKFRGKWFLAIKRPKLTRFQIPC